MVIDLNNLFNYANQSKPTYITKDNSRNNLITDEGATLGRVLFYDKKLSSNNTISCASCHLQEFAFGDTSLVSLGVNGTTGRHSMRLINNRFSEETKYFWDERANSLEEQSTMPIMDHIEMGFSGSNGDPDFSKLLEKLDSTLYYNDLFYLAYGDTLITQEKIQIALSQFIRSIQSFDSEYDIGREQVDHDSLPFPNYNQQQNNGKSLFLTPAEFNNMGLRIGGGFGCANCHRPPEFDIAPDSKSNGVVFIPGSTNPNGGVDTLVFKSPSLRDVVNQNGEVNGRLMHTANFASLTNVLNHYDRINLFQQIPGIENIIDDRLLPNGRPQDLNMTNQERNQVIRFLETLTGTDVYENEKWSDPFDQNGNLEVLNSSLVNNDEINIDTDIRLFPNPIISHLNIKGNIIKKTVEVYDLNGKLLKSIIPKTEFETIPFNKYVSGVYIIIINDSEAKRIVSQKIIKI